MRRRDVLKLAALSAGAAALRAVPAAALPPVPALGSGPIPIIDAHIHLFDPLRPGGVPWPEKTDTVIYKPALPDRYVQETAALGIVGAIAIEASPLATRQPVAAECGRQPCGDCGRGGRPGARLAIVSERS